MKSKNIKLDGSDKNCKEVNLLLHRNEETESGVLITGWYEESNTLLYASKFIKMSIEDSESFIRDYSMVSACDFIYNQ